ncbi:MAG: class F sortase [Patescibacteria group bacterium]
MESHSPNSEHGGHAPEPQKHWRHKSRTHTGLYAFVVAVVVVGFGGYVLYRLSNITGFVNPIYPVGPVKNVGLPSRLVIPTINIDANIQNVGLTAAGRVGIPNNFTDVAWFNKSPKPGEAGSAVIDGHLDTARDANAVFIHLDQLKRGDQVYVTDTAGQKITFQVVNTAIYDDSNAPLAEIFDTTGSIAKLNLITCDGVWIQKVHSYSKRLVVYTERVLE